MPLQRNPSLLLLSMETCDERLHASVKPISLRQSVLSEQSIHQIKAYVYLYPVVYVILASTLYLEKYIGFAPPLLKGTSDFGICIEKNVPEKNVFISII